MNLRSIINFGETLSVVTGVNIHLHEGDSLHASFVVLKQEKGVVKQHYAASNIYTWDQLEQELKTHVPEGSRVHVNIEGRGVLQKGFSKNEKSSNQQSFVKQIFPMIDEKDFAYQFYSGAQVDFLQITRKDILHIVEKICTRYAWMSFSLGAFIGAALLPLLDAKDIVIPHYTIKSKDNRILDIALNEIPETDLSPIRFSNENISSNILLAYAAGLYLLIGLSDLNTSSWQLLQKNEGTYAFNKHLYQAGKWALIILLSVLLINAVIYFQLQGTVNELELQESLANHQNKKESTLKRKSRDLRAAYDKIGWRSNMLPVFYADQLAQFVPDEIQLTSLDIGVLDENLLKTARKYSYETSLIHVKGLTENPVAVQQLVHNVETLPWVFEITGQRYSHDTRQNKGLFEFIIHIR